MIHHLGIVVADFMRSKALFDACLAPLGIRRTETDMDWAIYGGENGQPFLWLGSEIPTYWRTSNMVGNAPIHIAFMAPNRHAVDAFYYAALEFGAEDHGAPGLRQTCGHSYSAYIIDLDGNNIEATIQEK
ncbi:catechol 2,3-dioxygenase-like lactoylglutathione lyase family enzyme [Pseudoduganella lurida]|uniref:Catechol 2,3-dioxygenase-like lactoylglutathione lyase family enzyme n=1 Tax=Pseudoduganella lurida TaxID=1036180 RepID=A0A562R1D6_9BURK|nr:VOC family protein [Pseudoduganella lurida]TWI62895.1 catechol 2,3-dioxygenase-like lactoylglutathione lyase family enzyme [Pseudoduganella lurida]